jgi:photosystem II stability/assembly factor-like uncharacterized protein
MTDISEHIVASDPVSYSELLKLSSDPVFDELFQAVVTGDDVLQSLPAGRDERPELVAISPARRTDPRRLIIALASSAVAAALLIAAVTAPGLRTLDRNHRAGATYGRQRAGLQGGTPAWHLVGYISPSWRTQPSVGLQPGLSLTCPDATTCYLVDFPAYPLATGPGVEVTDDGGGTWRQLALPLTLSVVSPVACSDAETCALLGDDSAGNAVFLETTDGGQSWAATAGPPGLTSQEQLVELSCVSRASCVAVAWWRPEHAGGPGEAAIAYSTNDSGSTWATTNLPQDFVPLALKCAGSSMCVAVGSLDSPNGSPGMALYSADGGSTWNTASLPPAAGQLTGLSCANASDCLASFFAPASNSKIGMTSSLLVTADGGQSWTPAPSPPQQFITGLSCPSALQCWASGLGRSHGSGQPVRIEGAISFTSNGGSTWQQSQLPEGTGPVLDISCPAASNCYAIARENARSEPVRLALLAYGG